MPHHTGPRLWQLDALRGPGPCQYDRLPRAVRLGLCLWPALRLVRYQRAGLPHLAAVYLLELFCSSPGSASRFRVLRSKTGLLTLGCAAVLTVVTAVFLPGQAIWFGVLHLTGCALVLTALLRPVWQRHPPGRRGWRCRRRRSRCSTSCPSGWLGFRGGAPCAAARGAVPPATGSGSGLPDLSRFSSADYFPLLPWLFLFWCGYFIARLCGRGTPARRRGPRRPAALRGLCCAGRHTLLLYMLHQPVVYGGAVGCTRRTML